METHFDDVLFKKTLTIQPTLDAVGFTLRAFSGQTVDIFEIYDPSGVLIAGIGSGGDFAVNSITQPNGNFSIDPTGYATFFGGLITFGDLSVDGASNLATALITNASISHLA